MSRRLTLTCRQSRLKASSGCFSRWCVQPPSSRRWYSSACRVSWRSSRYSRRLGYRLLAVLPEHAAAVADLPPHHQDPFDRLLVAQALTEPLRLLTHDAMVARYSDTIIEI